MGSRSDLYRHNGTSDTSRNENAVDRMGLKLYDTKQTYIIASDSHVRRQNKNNIKQENNQQSLTLTL